MHWLLVGYMFLFIDRPFEVWSILGDLRIERVYMGITLAYWVIYPDKRWLPNIQHLAYGMLASTILGCWVMSPWMDRAQSQSIVEDWFKIIVFYGLLVTTVHDERGLRRLTVGFLAVMGLYLTHSFREYLGGRHTYRMGIARMIGVDTSLGDPNSFGASIIFAMPFVTAFWRAGIWGRFGQLLLAGYTALSGLCILLTGSRGSLIGFIVWLSILVMGHSKRFLWLTLATIMAPVVFMALPESLQTRFETIIDSDVGPANAKTSGEGRIEGFLTGLKLWAANPLNGVGPGAWRPATGSSVESHNLFGQLLGELGTAGLVSFGFMISCFIANFLWIRKVRRVYPEWQSDLVCQIPSSISVALFLLLFMGIFGHNLFRFSWIWYGGFLIIARYCLELRLSQANQVAEYELTTFYSEYHWSMDENADDLTAYRQSNLGN